MKKIMADGGFNRHFLRLCLGGLLAAGVPAGAGEIAVLALAARDKVMPQMQQYGVRVEVYNQRKISQTVGAEFENDLAHSRTLIVMRGGENAARDIFAKSAYRDAIREFLARGGALFFDYNTYHAVTGGPGADFLRSIGVPPPPACDQATHKDYKGVLTEAGLAALGHNPNVLPPAHFSGGFGGWLNPPDGMAALARMDISPQAAALLECSNVAGRGRIYFSQLAALMTEKHPASFENVWSLLLGENIRAGGPGMPAAAADAFAVANPPANPLYLAEAHKRTAWRLPEYKKRLPILAAEPVGLARRGAPAGIVLDKSVLPGGFRLTTDYGAVIPAQAAPLPDGKTEIVFQTDLLPYGHLLFFLYADGPDAPADAAGMPGLAVAESGAILEVANNALVAGFLPDAPGLASLRWRSGCTENAISGWRGIDTGMALAPTRADANRWLPARIVERGPVRVVVEQREPVSGQSARFVFYAGDMPAVAHDYALPQPGGTVDLASRWAPGGQSANCVMAYESPAGIRLIEARFEKGDMAPAAFDNLQPFMKEGWYAIQDAAGAGVGLCFAREAARIVSLERRAHTGAGSRLHLQLEGQRHHALVVLTRAGWQDARAAYIAYRHPPEIRLGVWQTLDAFTPPAVPRPDRDCGQLLYFRSRWMKPGLAADTPAEAGREKARRMIAAAVQYGANIIRPAVEGAQTPASLACWEELVRLAAANGLAIFGFAPPANPLTREEMQAFDAPRPCPVKDRIYYLRTFGDGAEASARHGGGDYIHVMDEYSWNNTNAAAQALFQQRYGGAMPLPQSANWGDTSDRDYANLLLFRTEIITELARDAAQAIRARCPRTIISSVVNYKGMDSPFRWSDLEEHSRYLDMGGIDLYSSLNNYRRLLMYARGAFGNQSRVENCIGYADPGNLAQQMDLCAVYGASMQYFSGSDYFQIAPWKTADIVGPYYRWLKYSGMNSLLNAMAPVKYAALLRDKALLAETIRNLEMPKEQSNLAVERGLLALADLNGIQMDMIFSRFFNLEALKGYRLLLVPDNKYLSPEFAGVIQSFIEQGGCAFIEGASCAANDAMRKLCQGGKIIGAVDGKTVSRRDIHSGKLLYSGEFISERLPVNPAAKAELMALLIKEAGPPPVAIESAGAADMDAVLYSDGRRYLLNVVNRSPFIAYPAQFTINPPLGQPAAWVNMRTGEHGLLTNSTLACVLPAESAGFFAIIPSREAGLPAVQPAPQTAACYCLHRGMAFLSHQRDRAIEPAQPKIPEKINVGVFVHPGIKKNTPHSGQLGLAETLQQPPPDMAVTVINTLAPETLGSFDVVVLGNIRKAAPAEGWERNIREYVTAGGGALLVHHAVGYGSASRAMFPEIGRGVDFVPYPGMEITADHPAITGTGLEHGVPGLHAGQKFTGGFPDFISLMPGANGQVLVRSQSGRTGKPENAIVAGTAGAGRTVLCGLELGCQAVPQPDGSLNFITAVAPEHEYKILMNAIRWLAAGP